jgi:ribosome-binding protein aMBF1 (putative translation factor)
MICAICGQEQKEPHDVHRSADGIEVCVCSGCKAERPPWNIQRGFIDAAQDRERIRQEIALARSGMRGNAAGEAVRSELSKATESHGERCPQRRSGEN